MRCCEVHHETRCVQNRSCATITGRRHQPATQMPGALGRPGAPALHNGRCHVRRGEDFCANRWRRASPRREGRRVGHRLNVASGGTRWVRRGTTHGLQRGRAAWMLRATTPRSLMLRDCSSASPPLGPTAAMNTDGDQWRGSTRVTPAPPRAMHPGAQTKRRSPRGQSGYPRAMRPSLRTDPAHAPSLETRAKAARSAQDLSGLQRHA